MVPAMAAPIMQPIKAQLAAHPVSAAFNLKAD
jgi:hypothetical protein